MGRYTCLPDEWTRPLLGGGVLSIEAAVLVKLCRQKDWTADGRVFVTGGSASIAAELGITEANVNEAIRRLKRKGILSTKAPGKRGHAAEYYITLGKLGATSQANSSDSLASRTPIACAHSTTPKNNGGDPLEAGPTKRHVVEEHHEDPIEAALRNYHPEGHDPDTSGHDTERAGRQAQPAPDAAAHDKKENDNE